MSYRFRLAKEHFFSLADLPPADPCRWPWLEYWRDGMFKIPAGYEWDGCSPKMSIGPLVLGTHDGPLAADGHPQTYWASLVHDAMYQYVFELAAHFRLSVRRVKAGADELFYLRLLHAGFRDAELYYRAVHWLGWGYIARRWLFDTNARPHGDREKGLHETETR